MKKENMTTEKKTRGGKRDGSGRPRLQNAKKPISFRADEDVYNAIIAQKDKAEFINGCIRACISGED